MGSSLWLVVANIIMTEFEDIIIKPLIAKVQLSFIVALLMSPYW